MTVIPVPLASHLELVDDVAALGTCPRAKVGAALIVAGQVVATGWNTTTDGAECSHPLTAPCPETLHAEAAALAAAAREGSPVLGALAVLSLSPCVPCARLLVAVGVRGVVYRSEYRDPAGLLVLQRAGVPTLRIPEEA